MCTVLLPSGVNPIAVNKYINIISLFELANISHSPSNLCDKFANSNFIRSIEETEETVWETEQHSDIETVWETEQHSDIETVWETEQHSDIETVWETEQHSDIEITQGLKLLKWFEKGELPILTL